MCLDVWKIILVVFSYRTRNHSENLTRSIYNYRRIVCIRRNEMNNSSLLFEVFECHISVKWCNHYISVIRREWSIEYNNVSFYYPSIHHAISFYLHKKCRGWMLDEVFLQVHLTRWLRFRSKWESCTNGFKKRIPYKFICRYISSILEYENSLSEKFFEESLHSSRVRISKELTHLIQWMIDSSTPKEFTECIDLALIIIIWSHNLYKNIYKLYSEF